MRMLHKKISIKNRVLIVIGAAISFGSPMSYAYDFVKDFSLISGTSYDDNLGLSSQRSIGAFRYTLTPNLSLSRQDEVDNISIRGSLNIVRSSVSEDLILDREDPSFNANWAHQFNRGSFSLGGNYVKNSTRVSELDQTGLVFRDGNSISKSVNTGLNYELSDRINTTLNLALNKQTYTDSNLADFKSYVSSIQINYEYSEKISFYTNGGYSKFYNQQNGQVVAVGQNDSSQNLKRISFGVNYQYSPAMDFDFSFGQNQLSTGDNGWVAGANMSYEPSEYTIFKAAYSRGYYASGLGAFQESDNLNVNLSRVVSAFDRVGFSFSWNINRSLNTNNTKNFNAFYNHDLSDHWTTGVSYIHRSISSGGGSSASGSQLGFTLTYNLPNF